MGLILKLAVRNLRKHPGRAVLLLLVIGLATTTLSLGLAVNETAHDPWNRLHSRINGFHVKTYAAYLTQEQLAHAPYPLPDPANVARADGLLAKLAAEPGVAAVGGPWPVLLTDGRIGGVPLPIWVEGRDTKPAAVSQPLVTSGSWLDDGDDGVVLEDGLASLLRVKPGEEVVLAGQSLRVRGSAMTTSVVRYPGETPGIVWAGQGTAAKLRAAGAIPLGAMLELRLARAQDAAAFVAAQKSSLRETDSMRTWEQARSRSGGMDLFAAVLTGIATLLAGLGVATAVVLVTGRMAAQGRQIGTLKAVGVTPRQALGVVLAEYLAVAVVAAVIGILVGTLLSPLIARDFPNLYGAPAAPPITWPRALAAFAVAMLVVAAGSVQPALRGVRQSTVRALGSRARPPRRSSRAARFAGLAGLPLPAIVGLRSALRRPGRSLANASGLALGVATVIVGLGASKAAQNFLDSPTSEQEAAMDRAVGSFVIDQVLAIVFIGAGVLLGLAALNALVVAIFAARDSAGNHAILRVVGATPTQTVVSLVVAQLGAALLGCAAGIPLGVLLFNVALASGTKDVPPIALSAFTYAAVAAAVPLLYLMIVIFPAIRLARRPVAEVLTYE